MAKADTPMRTPNPWLQHVNVFRQANPDMSYKQVLKSAGATYTRKPKPEKSGERKPNPWMVHINKWKEANPEWRKDYSYKQVLIKCKETYKQ